MKIRLILPVAVHFLLHFSTIQACAHNGVCGHGTSCQSAASSGASTSSHSTCSTTGCTGGYQCGSYGCYRSRARSAPSVRVGDFNRPRADFDLRKPDDNENGGSFMAKSKQPPRLISRQEYSPSGIKSENPDDVFLDCCNERKLPDPCLNLCSYKTFNRDALQRMYFKQSRCPFEVASELQYCAAAGGDHRLCCEQNGVASTMAGNKCLIFCDQRPGNVTQLDLSFLACYDRFESMKSCFWHNINYELELATRRRI